MAGRFVRASKYRHVFGRSTKKEQCYDNLRISKNAWDSNIIKANPEYISVNWEASGGGAFAVIPINERGRLPEQLPLFRGHTAAVLDTDWSPFNDSLVASGSDDAKVFIWEVPKDFTLYSDAEEPADVAPVAKLTGHTRKVGHVLFNPAAENVLASSSGDCTVRLWDVEAGATKLSLKHADILQSMSWNADGSLLVTTSRDKKMRIWDTRQEKPAHEVPGHPGAKNSRAVWMGEHDRIATTGFSRMSDRQLGLWDSRSPKEPIGGFTILDSISGVCMPFWDEGTQCLYLAGKGDGNIRYYEYEHDKFEYLSEYKSADPQRGIAFMPKRGINLHDNEVLRCFKTVSDSYIEPISFIVPRRAEVFQSDIYPPTTGSKPAVSASEWFGGKTGLPPKISLESVYEGDVPADIPSEYKPSASTAPVVSPPAAKAEPETPKPTPAPTSTVAARGPAPTMKDNKASIATMASKFADKDDEDDDEEDETSSFEEIPKPIERPTVAASRVEEKAKEPEPPKAAAGTTVPKATPVSTSPAPQVAPSTQDTPVPTPAPTTAHHGPTPSGAAAGIKDYLTDIKSLLEQQAHAMTTQSEQIANLTQEVNTLKSKVGDQGNTRAKDERIRQLELELEEARS
ncbi:coronin-6 [Lophium mytilinum]|uniref:Coronin n=1 Tax=Lophium mytilinum TaxID=390894 RepID=A0A6A6QYP1_9PEZI|nr:coronin-6 [Lophium mytilinum]